MNRSKQAFGNWVSLRLVVSLASLAALAAILAAAAGAWPGLRWTLIAIAALFAASSAYFARARRLLSPKGGDAQRNVANLLVARVVADGHASLIDIGCGDGSLDIAVAKSLPGAKVTGIDYWGGMWGYSQELCERNAAASGLSDRLAFVKASAAALPFPDESFDFAFSNMVFHEVSGPRDKKELLREALRVVRRGGGFAFQDLFKLRRSYGSIDEILAFLGGIGARDLRFVDTSESPFIPRELRLPFMVGSIGLVYGTK
jgi:SAM-dependent methyltransferase